MKRYRKLIAFCLCTLMALPIWRIPSSAIACTVAADSVVDDGLILDPASLRVIELENMELVHSQNISFDPLSIQTAPLDPSKACSFALYVNSYDEEDSVLIVGGVDSFGQKWIHSVQYSREDADDLLLLMEANGGVSFNTSQFVSTSSIETGYWDGFWDGYWHYLTNPWDMDDDLEYAFYGAVGTAAVAGTAAGGVAAWGAMGGGQFAVGITGGTSATSYIPHITYGFGTRGVYTWAHGVGAAGFTTTYGAVPGTVTLTGIPILAPGAVATWVGTRPDVGDCAKSAVIAFFRGLWPF